MSIALPPQFSRRMTSASALPTLMETVCALACDGSAEKPGHSKEVSQARCLGERGGVVPPARAWASFGREKSLDVGAMRGRSHASRPVLETGQFLSGGTFTTSPDLEQGQFGRPQRLLLTRSRRVFESDFQLRCGTTQSVAVEAAEALVDNHTLWAPRHTTLRELAPWWLPLLLIVFLGTPTKITSRDIDDAINCTNKADFATSAP